MSTHHLLGGVLIALLFLILVYVIKKLRHRSLLYLPGPPSSSWLAGNLSDLQRPPNSVGDTEFAWIDQYGTAIKISSPFGKELLYLADPKGLQYILNTSGYQFPKTKEKRALFLYLAGPGLVFAEGEQHARHRKVMNPAFSHSALKRLLPIFFQIAAKMSDKWKQLAQDSGSTSAVVNASEWLSLMTLDMIGEAAFNYQFGCLDHVDNELAKAFKSLLGDTLAQPSDTTIAAQAAMNYLPLWIHKAVVHIPLKPLKRLAHYLSTAHGIAKELVAQECEVANKSKPIGKDVMSVLVRSNGSEDPRRRLSDVEIHAQMTTFILAGHETTGSSIVWLLYEVSKRPDVQRKIRDETRAARIAAATRGDKDLSMTDLEAMSYTQATIKETLRFHPVGLWVSREASRDDVIPLSIPQRIVSGDYVDSIPVSKGQQVLISFCAYNRLKGIWGADAHEWKPERFLHEIDNQYKSGLGVVSNLATFSSGVRNCIAWRFALLQMQATLIELVENFAFAPPDGEVIRVYAGPMIPMIKGQQGTQMPLTITPLSELQ